MTKASAKESPVIYGDGNQYRDFVFVKDVVRFNLLAASAEQANGKTFNVGTGKFISINMLWEMISHLAGVSIEPEYKRARPGDIRESVASIDYAKKNLGFEPGYSFENGLKETFEYYLTTNEHK
jgi:nucleoside-diphosphate-sugar epimerase